MASAGAGAGAAGDAGEDAAGASHVPLSRFKAIAQQEREMGALGNDTLERISTAAHDLLQDLVKGGLRVARERQAAAKGGRSGAAGPVTIQPEDICAFVASEGERLAFLRRVTEPASQQAGFLEGYRARTKTAASASSKKRQRGGVARALAGVAGAAAGEEEEEGGGEYEDEEVEDAFLKGQGEGGKGDMGGGLEQGEGAAAGGGGGGSKGAVDLDEDYDD